MGAEVRRGDFLAEEERLQQKKVEREGTTEDENDQLIIQKDESLPRAPETTQSKEVVNEELEKLKREILHNAGFREDGTPMERLGFLGSNIKQLNFARALNINMDVINKSKKPPEALRNETGRQEKLIRNGVEKVMTDLAHTLGEIGLDAIEQYSQDPSENSDYLSVARTINQLALALRETGRGSITFRRDADKEALIRKQRKGDDVNPPDEVYIYKSGPMEFNGTRFESVEFFIRPRRYKRQFKSRSGGVGYETRQERTNITVTSPDLPLGVASIRIDPPSRYSQKRITFDVVVGGDENNVLETLDLSNAGQEAGHHFTSEYTANDLQILPSQIHEGIAARLDALTQQSKDIKTTPEDLAA